MSQTTNYLIAGHTVKVTKANSAYPANPNGCVHTPAAYTTWKLNVDGTNISPPQNAPQFINMRADGFDTPETAFSWAWRMLEDTSLPGYKKELQNKMREHVVDRAQNH